MKGYNSLLTAADFTPAWTSDRAILRYAPTVLVAPIEPGVTVDYLGNPVLPRVDTAHADMTLDTALDYLFVGNSAWASTTPLACATNFTGGRNVRFVGIDTGGYKMSVQKMTSSLYIEGVRGDYTSTTEGDFLFVGGNGIDQYAPGLPRVTIQNCASKGQHGTNRVHGVPAGITSITSNASGIVTVVLANTPAIVPVAGNSVIVGGTTYNGAARVLADFNITGEIVSVTDATHFTMKTSDGRYPYPASASITGTTGSVWVMGTIPGEHADGVQHTSESDKYSAAIRMHNITVETNYCGSIMSHDPEIRLSNWNYVFKPSANAIAYPNDIGSECMRIGDQTVGSGTRLKELYNCYAEVRPAFDIQDQIAPSDAPSQGGQAGVSNGRNIITWARTEFSGGVIEGLPPGGNFATFADLGFAYPASAVYSEEAPVTANSLLGIGFSGSSVIPETIPAGAEIGLFDVVHDLGAHHAVIDLALAPGSDSGRFFLHGRRLVRGRAAFDYETQASFTISVVATIRGSSTSISRSFTFTIANDGTTTPLTLSSAYQGFSAKTTTASGTPSVNSFPAFPIGPATSTRRIVVGVFTNAASDRSVQSVTVGGVAASPVMQRKVQTTTYSYAEMWIAFVPASVVAGTSADIVVTLSGTGTCIAIATAHVSGLSGDAPYDTAFATGPAGANLTNVPTAKINKPANGVVIAFEYYSTPSGGNKYAGGAVTATTAAADGVQIGTEVTAGTAGPLIWTGLARSFDEKIETAGAGGSVLVAAAFAPVT